MSMQEMHERMEKKAAEDKEYYMSIWRSHIQNLVSLVDDEVEGGLSYPRYVQLRDELIANADATWEHNHGKV